MRDLRLRSRSSWGVRAGRTVALSLAVVVGLQAATCSFKSEEEKLIEAEGLYQARNVIAAMIAFQDFLKKYPNSPYKPRATNGLAMCYLADKDFDRARETLDQVVEMAGGPATEMGFGAMMIKLNSYAQQPDLPGGLQAALATSDSMTIASPLMRKTFQFRMGQFMIANERTADGAELLRNILSSQVAGQDEAMLHLKTMQLITPTIRDESGNRAVVEFFRAYLESHPNSPLELELRRTAARLLSEEGAKEEAEAEFDTIAANIEKRLAETQDPDQRAMLYLAQADTLTGRGRKDEAADIYRKVIDEFPTSPIRPSAMQIFAQHMYERGDLESSINLFTQVQETYPGTPVARQAAQAIQAIRARQASGTAPSTTDTLENQPVPPPQPDEPKPASEENARQ